VEVPTALLSDLTELAGGGGLDAGLLQAPLKALVGGSALRSVPIVDFSSPSSATASPSP
jgi:hypothetical protein